MDKRSFRTRESYVSERITRDMLADFLRERGFSNVTDSRKRYGENESQILSATSPTGELLAMRVRLCWRRDGRSPRQTTYSAAQLLPSVKNNDWEGTFREKIAREAAEGVNHLLVVQRDGERIIFAAAIPLTELVEVWCAQRDISRELIAEGKLGQRHKNHAMNGSSPTIWLQDDRAPAVAAALWNHRSVFDLARLPIVEGLGLGGSDDTFDDILGIDYSQLGSDGAARTPVLRSTVRRNPRFRARVLDRAGNACERRGCGETCSYPGFLDVHHILGADKSDRYWNCVALCPNCHREAHIAPHREQINAELRGYAEQFAPKEESA
jgi:5-methylcytosine-specific restriction protein A